MCIMKKIILTSFPTFGVQLSGSSSANPNSLSSSGYNSCAVIGSVIIYYSLIVKLNNLKNNIQKNYLHPKILNLLMVFHQSSWKKKGFEKLILFSSNQQILTEKESLN